MISVLQNARYCPCILEYCFSVIPINVTPFPFLNLYKTINPNVCNNLVYCRFMLMNLFMFKLLIKFFFMPKENVYLYLHLIMLHTILIN